MCRSDNTPFPPPKVAVTLRDSNGTEVVVASQGTVTATVDWGHMNEQQAAELLLSFLDGSADYVGGIVYGADERTSRRVVDLLARLNSRSRSSVKALASDYGSD